ncbi:transposase [Bordetella pertussis]|nr:transposase [Bordetella pertussis]
MNTHKHARLTFLRRLEMVQQLIAHQVCVPEAARAYGVTAPTVRKWLGRFLAQGQAGLADASSRPTVSPPERLRRPRRAGYRGAAPQAADPSAHRPGAGRVSQHRQPRPGPRRSVAPGRPGAGRAGGALRASGPPAICCTSTSRSWDVSSALATGSRATDAIPLRGAGWDFVFVAIDDHARVAFTDIHPDERFPSAVQFLKDAVAYYQRLGVTIQRLLTDNGSAFRSRAFAALCHELGIKHRFTRPTAHRPMARPNASSSRPCVSGLTLTPTRTPNTEPMP